MRYEENIGFCVGFAEFFVPYHTRIGVFYKLRDKERSKESAYVLVGFLARPFVSFISHIARYAPSSGENLTSKMSFKSDATYYFHITKRKRQQL